MKYVKSQLGVSNVQVVVKMRVFTKRGKTRRDRVETLKAEKKDCEYLHKSTEVQSLKCSGTKSRAIVHSGTSRS